MNAGSPISFSVSPIQSTQLLSMTIFAILPCSFFKISNVRNINYLTLLNLMSLLSNTKTYQDLNMLLLNIFLKLADAE